MPRRTTSALMIALGLAAPAMLLAQAGPVASDSLAKAAADGTAANTVAINFV